MEEESDDWLWILTKKEREGAIAKVKVIMECGESLCRFFARSYMRQCTRSVLLVNICGGWEVFPERAK